MDIKQGKLGDCYFLSSLTSISEYPFIIKRIFETTEVSTYGIYGVWLFIDGLWKNIVVDEVFPCHNKKPVFSRNNSNELWVMIL
jgi:calpain-15